VVCESVLVNKIFLGVAKRMRNDGLAMQTVKFGREKGTYI
jgi:hypothetical protein